MEITFYNYAFRASMFMNEFSMIHILSENKSAASSSLTKTCQLLHGNNLTATQDNKENYKMNNYEGQKAAS